MSILFWPQLVLEDDAYEEISESLIEISTIIEAIFSHFMGAPLEERGRVKIYNAHPYIHTILFNMAEYIGNTYPGKYNVRLYKNWIDIEDKEATHE